MVRSHGTLSNSLMWAPWTPWCPWPHDHRGKEDFVWNTRNVLLGTQDMFCVEHIKCFENTGIAVFGTEELSCLEHIKCFAWNTGNVLHGHRNSIPWWHHPSITLQVLIRNSANELSQLACSFVTLSPSMLIVKFSQWFHKVFVNFSMFWYLLESVRTCVDVFGRIQMRSDAFGCVWRHFDASGNFEIFGDFSAGFDDFWIFLDLGG